MASASCRRAVAELRASRTARVPSRRRKCRRCSLHRRPRTSRDEGSSERPSATPPSRRARQRAHARRRPRRAPDTRSVRRRARRRVVVGHRAAGGGVTGSGVSGGGSGATGGGSTCRSGSIVSAIDEGHRRCDSITTRRRKRSTTLRVAHTRSDLCVPRLASMRDDLTFACAVSFRWEPASNARTRASTSSRVGHVEGRFPCKRERERRICGLARGSGTAQSERQRASHRCHRGVDFSPAAVDVR